MGVRLAGLSGSSLLAGSQNWGQQYYQRVQQKMGWLSGGALSFHFTVSKAYGRWGRARPP